MTEKEYELIEKTFAEKNLYAEIFTYKHFVCIDIEHGDWKHDHLRSDFLIEQLGYRVVDERVNFSDGSDNYSATHVYEKI